jgi:hypothetical protein
MPTRNDGETTAQLALCLASDIARRTLPLLEGGLRQKKTQHKLFFEHFTVILNYRDVPAYVMVPKAAHAQLTPILKPRFDAINTRDRLRRNKRKAEDELDNIKKERRMLEADEADVKNELARLEAQPEPDLAALFM